MHTITEWIFYRINIFRMKLDLSKYATKTDLKSPTGADASKFVNKVNLPNLKPNVDELDIDKLNNIPSSLSNLKSKADKLDVDKLELVPIEFK